MNAIHTLTLDSVSKSFSSSTSTVKVIDTVTYTFESSKSYALTGASGSGKSTIMHLLCGLDTPTHGAVFFDASNIDTFSSQQRAQFLNHHIGLVFQESLLLQELSVVENIMLKGLIAGQPYDQCRKHAMELLERIELVEKAESHPYSLSGGQQQRVAIMRALFNKPAFLLADEPTGNLDDTAGRSIIKILKEYQEQFGVGLIIASHDPEVANAMEEVLKLHDGVFCI